MRVGIGYDVHKLIAGRDLILGGIKIPNDKGLLGHSDADVLTHAIMDAILGAMAEGDIGVHFPDSEEAYMGISSLELLNRVVLLMKKNRYEIGNIDTVIMAEKPKLHQFTNEMKQNLCKVLGINANQLSIKATTTEKLGFIGREEGIAAECIVLLTTNELFSKL
ncbi:MAG: 2-C-methyl-D-erythritol 2,4-cyclodiphosphate synthase [Clostridiales bacterium 38_11]|nr:MAG: 2-C-methyl-D-erythritol 2,4-cyclodiphosphate synthase [Clostridiales bacterium 38_11]HBH13402.1 2-C-methyl-D-erythritol 2,4-cyclodiphosphate synthase [Clostridiales bacterium]